MRSVPLLLVALLVSTPLASASIERDNEVMGLVAVYRQGTVVLAWQPTPGAIEYGVYRETARDDYVLVGTTNTPFYVDTNGPTSVVGYIVLVVDAVPPPGPAGAGASPQKGSCVSASASGATVTASNCLPESASAHVEL